nr:NADH dehydrogenase subunit 2 [Malacanthus plumieri]
MTPYVSALLLWGLGTGTAITFGSSHWLIAWMGLEINTLAILPIMALHYHPRATEAATKYFIIQAVAAAMLLFACTSNAWISGQWTIQQNSHPLPVIGLTAALALKIGLAPFHTWVPEVLQGLELSTGLIMSTWQKLAPFALLLQIQPQNSSMLIVLGLTSTLIGGWGGLNQTQLRKIIAYSSISHLGWMIIALQFSPSLTLLTLIIYLIMTSAVFLMFKVYNATTINMLAISWAKYPTIAALTALVLLSLGGLPPLTGFMPKWMILEELTKQGLALTATLAAMSALISLYFYLRLTYALTLTMFPNVVTGATPWRLGSLKQTLPLAFSTMMSLALLPMTPAIIALTSI